MDDIKVITMDESEYSKDRAREEWDSFVEIEAMKLEHMASQIMRPSNFIDIRKDWQETLGFEPSLNDVRALCSELSDMFIEMKQDLEMLDFDDFAVEEPDDIYRRHWDVDVDDWLDCYISNVKYVMIVPFAQQLSKAHTLVMGVAEDGADE